MATPRRSRQTKKTPTSQRKAEASGVTREYYDPKMEFDAPMFHNFNSVTPDSGRVDDWFETRMQQMQSEQFVEPKYSPITLQKALEHSKRQKIRTPSTRKAKKVMGVVPELTEEIPKMSLEDATEDAPRAPAASLKNALEAQVSQQPAVPASALEKLASLPEMRPFVVAAPVPLATNEPKVEEGSSLQAMRGVLKPAVAAPPIRKRTMWVKPDMPLKPRDPSPQREEVAPVPLPLKPEVQVRPIVTRLSLKPFASTISSKTPAAPRSQAAIPTRTPAATRTQAATLTKPAPSTQKLTARTAPQRPVIKKPTVPVSPRCYHSRNTRSQTQALTRSQSSAKPQSQFGARSLTRPKEFSFMSREPAVKKQKSEFVPEKVKELTVFPSLLRADSEPPSRHPQGLTRPVEFHFATNARAKDHAMQHPADLELPHASKEVVENMRTNGVTQPREFTFATSRRARATMPPISLPQVPKTRQTYANTKPAGVAGKRLTVPQAFNLSKSNRTADPPLAVTRAAAKLASQPERAVPRKRELTVPVTPRVAARKRKTPEKVAEEVIPFKARSAPQAAPFLPAEAARPLTVAEPFDLLTDMRGAEKTERLKRLAEEERQREAEARVFVARPLPAMDVPSGVPLVEPSPLTVFEPFNLQSESLALQAKQRLEEKILAEQALEDEMRKFKANPPRSLRRPFQTLTSNRPLTVAATPDLKSTTRALDRAEFSVDKNQRIALKEDREQQEQALEEAHEREEIRKLRKTLLFKAAPFVNPSPMRLAPTTRPLTVAESPQLRTALRSMR